VSGHLRGAVKVVPGMAANLAGSEVIASELAPQSHYGYAQTPAGRALGAATLEILAGEWR
jgi:hypothetical protein